MQTLCGIGSSGWGVIGILLGFKPCGAVDHLPIIVAHLYGFQAHTSLPQTLLLVSLCIVKLFACRCHHMSVHPLNRSENKTMRHVRPLAKLLELSLLVILGL